MRPYSVRRRGASPAQRADIRANRLSLKELLARRLFASRIRLPELLELYYRRTVKTPALGVNREHRLSYAF